MVEDILSVAPILVSNLTKVIAALGGVIFFYLIFNIINLMINRKKEKQLKKINYNLEEIKKLLKRKR
ncbi:MAG: hypothetical protein KKF67_01845 [Nanoarchaeota archaeon]|nr:hypothetical protein [Nanoarchaeota archaeon]